MSIVLIAPYPDLVQTATETLQRSPYTVRILLGDLHEGVRAAQNLIAEDDIHAIVSRGGTASLLRTNLSTPVFEIDVTGFDLLRAIYPHVKVSRKIAVIGYENVVSGARSIADTLGTNLGLFLVTEDVHIDRIVRDAIEWGADVIVGDTVSVTTARGYGIQTELVRSGPEAILSAVDAASRFLNHVRDEVLRNKRLNLIMDHADRGVLYLTADDQIEMMNAQAERFLNVHKERMIGLSVTSETVPEELSSAVKQRAINALIQLNGKDYIIEVFEIQSGSTHAATIVFLQSTGRIRDLEGMIRRQLTDRGLVATYRFETMTARSWQLRKTIDKARKYSTTDSTVLLLGETGAGKEVFAQSIHNASPRCDGPFVAVNCAALPDSLLESELFGYAEGAFTGARKGGKPGLFEMAHNGTIFLDEVNDMSATVQARFLRVLQEKQVMRVGDNRLYDINVRVIAACNTDLFQATESGVFRKDLYYRLSILDIEIPALRSRREDIVPLFSSFLGMFARQYGVQVPAIPQRLLDRVVSYPWPGNVRQLRNFAEKASVLFSVGHKQDEIVDELIGELESRSVRTRDDTSPDESIGDTLKDRQALFVREAWTRNGGNVSATARELGIDRATVRKYL
jgi:transcriptional regulator with PAS, ATPase and Fis domain